MDTTGESAPDPDDSPVRAPGIEGTGGSPTPRLTEPATEEPEDSIERERDAVGDGPDTGGHTPPDHAQ